MEVHHIGTSIRDYLLKTNVQLGATYAVSTASTNAYENGYAAAAKFLNASKDEVGFDTSALLLRY
jgi:selenocysteine lyase/cysteine desulfurase